MPQHVRCAKPRPRLITRALHRAGCCDSECASAGTCANVADGSHAHRAMLLPHNYLHFGYADAGALARSESYLLEASRRAMAYGGPTPNPQRESLFPINLALFPRLMASLSSLSLFLRRDSPCASRYNTSPRWVAFAVGRVRSGCARLLERLQCGLRARLVG